MGSRSEITVKYAKAYAKASKQDRGRILDEVVSVADWNRENARRRLVAAWIADIRQIRKRNRWL